MRNLKAISVAQALIDYDAATGAEAAEIFQETEIIEKHDHNIEHWVGISGDQSGNNWGIEDTLAPFTVKSGDGTFGAGTDIAKILGSTDTPIMAGNLFYDPHMIFIVSSSVSTRWRLRFIWGTGTVVAAIAAHQYSEVIARIDTSNPAQSSGAPVDIMIPMITVCDKLWIQGWNATNDATMTLMVGLHEYDE